ncbi:HPP family protein [Rhodoluna sp.]|uniref:HPP family protein n=1 Tax=Rhodoluna sp. TaxID=1969481 RepID=UPI0025EC0724|nr:HPP family protein [Rhodoluna sp.]
MRRFVKIKLPKPTWREVLVEFIGALIGIGVLVGLGDLTSVPLLWAPLGGTLVLVFGAHASPYSQPMNVLGGHLLSAGLGLILLWILPHTEISLIITVGLVIAAMRLTRLTHPPAGANPIVIYLTSASWAVLPTLALGAVVILILGFFVHKFSAHAYPAH